MKPGRRKSARQKRRIEKARNRERRAVKRLRAENRLPDLAIRFRDLLDLPAFREATDPRGETP